ncbi:response regulator [Noviherbaspirillum pedocola]|nr:response regulator transcription factor [Noviherbaspirillum pedocola]
MQGNAVEIQVMLVDDHQTMLWGLEKLIDCEAPRMQVVATARNGEEAATRAGLFAPDLVLLDLDLGGQDSLDLIPSLIRNGKTKVLVLTASTDQDKLDLAVRRGARGVLSKASAPQDVVKAIEKVHRGELWLDQAMLSRVLGHLINPAPQRPDPELERQSRLTGKERRVIQAIVEGNGALNKTIAQSLCISEHTLRNHLTSIYQKLDVANRLELYVYAVKHGLGAARAGGDVEMRA